MRRVTLCLTALLAASGVVGVAGGTLTFLMRNAPAALDPAVVTGWSIRAMDPVYEGLVAYDVETGDVIPRLAESWAVSEDGMSYVFHIRQGISFHDGAELTASAVVLNIDRILGVGTGPATVLGPVEGAEAVGPYEVLVRLKAIYPELLHALTQLYIVSPKAVETYRTDADPWASAWFRDNMSGTGPFRLLRWDPTAELVLTRNENYWQGWHGSPIDQIAFRVVLEVPTQRMMLERGEAHIIDQVALEDIATMRDDPRFVVHIISETGMFYLMMRSDRGPLSDPRARLAMTYAFPWEDYIEGAMLGVYPQGQGPIPRAMDVHDSTFPVYRQDLTKAAELFRGAGIETRGLTLTMRIVQAWTPMVRAAVMYQAALAELGITLRIQELNWTALVAQGRNQEQASDMSMVAVGAKMPTPVLLLADSFHSRGLGTAYNWGWYSNPRFDALLDAAAVALEPESRSQLYNEALWLLVEEAPALFVMENTIIFAMSSRVRNYKPNPYSPYIINFYDLELGD